MDKKVAVLGGGNGAFAMASDLALQGFEIRMWSKYPDEFREIKKTHMIKVSGPLIQGEAKISVVTDRIEEAIRGADLICSPIPAFTQTSVAESLLPHIEDGQVIFLSPGTFGSYLMSKRLREMGCRKDIAIGETGTLPFLTRKMSPVESRIVVRACNLPTGVFPARKTEEAIEKIRAVFPSVHPVEDALSGALMNAGPVIHPPLIVLNTGPIENPAPYDIHNEGTTPGIRKIISLLDEERIAVREAFGYKPNHYPLEDYYDETRPNEWMYPRISKKLLMESRLWYEKIDYKHRYATEDIACGLAFLNSAADYIGAAIPVARSLLCLAGGGAGVDFMKTGRTLQSVGLSHLPIEELRERLREGF
ncbi:MAG: glycerol-3-phosphate dehydrogenase [Deltaproteobacteria bacterium]|nr:MAG: glycerol-3-phosphate dehydrogenase [Deltaproteobacteria bacterium]